MKKFIEKSNNEEKRQVETLEKFMFSMTYIYNLLTKLEQINDDTSFLHQVGSGGHNRKLSVRKRSELKWTSTTKLENLSGYFLRTLR